MMAAEWGGGPGSSPPGSSGPAAADYSLLVVVGALRPGGLLEQLLRQIESGEFRESSASAGTQEPSYSRSTGREVRGALHNKTRGAGFFGERTAAGFKLTPAADRSLLKV